MKKRILSCFMALALCLTLLPTAALAAEKHQHCICGKTTHVDIGDHTGEHQITCDKWLPVLVVVIWLFKHLQRAALVPR